MPNRFQAFLGRLAGLDIPTAKPTQAQGVSGVRIYGGTPREIERSPQWTGQQKWRTASEIAVNVSIVAASVHYFCNLIAHPNWSVQPADDTSEAKRMAEFVEEVFYDMDTPWSRVVRRASMYRFHGFGIQEWIAKKRDQDSMIGFADIQSRPQHTIERWAVDNDGSILGVWQRSPQTGELLGIPRSKYLYLVEDTLTDSPEGLGMFRHLGEPYNRLKEYLKLETRGFERDLRGIPVGKVPLTLLREAVESGAMSKEDADKLKAGMEELVAMQLKQSDTGIIVDSQPYESVTNTGQNIASVPQWDLSLLTGGVSGLGELDKAIDRLQREMARILGTELLLMGDQGGNRALSQDKSRNLYLNANSVLSAIGDAVRNDLIDPLWTLNGLPDELKPYPAPEDVAFRDVEQVTASLRDMATAGATLMPDDPVINDVRDLLGVSHQPEIDTEMLQTMRAASTQPNDDIGDELEDKDLDDA